MIPERYDTVVIGGGQAGLTAGYYLSRQQGSFVILDAHERVGDAWRKRWAGRAQSSPTAAAAQWRPGACWPGRSTPPVAGHWAA